jgi:threonine synthase
VSAAQQRLFTTLGGNVTAVSVAGTFDACQRLVRRAFADEDLRRCRPLASANSINVGRLLPQVFYYFHLVAQLPEPPSDSRPLLVATPSGNFGNLTAGLMAKRLGLPVRRFIAATNVNDVVPEYLASGVFRPRPSQPTLSNAMDVGDPSNLRRIRHLYDDDLERLRADVVGIAVDDETTLETMRAVRTRFGYLLDPHGAVGWRALDEVLAELPSARGAVLATAHPAKFVDTVMRATGETVSLPPALAECLARKESVVEIEASDEALASLLRDSALAQSTRR